MNEVTKKSKMYQKAKKIVISDNNTSISYLQRKLEIGYNRARAIIESLEADAIITAPNSDGIRTII